MQEVFTLQSAAIAYQSYLYTMKFLVLQYTGKNWKEFMYKKREGKYLSQLPTIMTICYKFFS